ncbi:hypothetical protein CEXT_618421 [Caerostris extrusa]|uniref:Uncharacterized protein n=1 Tax=Caerostris extrusa TaxID=172846 RepID=A0AAV4WD09_CAEEX|nr:hypothetical protein CEXT_618421 [Caerostris extrusa]
MLRRSTPWCECGLRYPIKKVDQEIGIRKAWRYQATSNPHSGICSMEVVIGKLCTIIHELHVLLYCDLHTLHNCFPDFHRLNILYDTIYCCNVCSSR